MKFTVVCPQNLEKVQKYALSMDRSLKERTQFLAVMPSGESAEVGSAAYVSGLPDVLIVFGKENAHDDDSICTGGVCDTSAYKLKAKITVACGEGIKGDLRCGLSADCDLTFSSLQKNKLQICLLHPVKCLDGHICEPFEFASRGSVGNAFTLLAAAAVKILCVPNRKLPE